MYYFSPATSGFYHSDLHGPNIPADAFELSEGEYCALVSNAPKGTVLSLTANGRPERVLLAEQTIDATERAWRDKVLDRTQWLVLRDAEELEVGGGTTLRADEFKQLLAYRQALRDWPNDPDFPDARARPLEPDWLEGLLRSNG
ncbi:MULTISPECIES: phage tail assembly chaperone [Pseudomonas]|uniref:Phage tail assembly chaperone n=1 Tax=Pseudomonas aphyarum TaxID=2942629 RepID=A0ABT5PVX1_9PSED|nr:phage tail assembly chaperone [Pseudomonas aphyarum]MDD0967261.1 phage tail assembly chaperone [Pseudomonas aphyarum]MDD1127988.1 phage tail assembly chaperone [Pseudomonas aphyarum]